MAIGRTMAATRGLLKYIQLALPLSKHETLSYLQ